MKKAVFLALGILLVASGIVWAQPPGCTWEGDPSFRFGWGATYAGWAGYTPPPGYYHGGGAAGNWGPDTTWGVPGQNLVFKVGPYASAASWLPPSCKAIDTLCFEIADQLGWTIVCNPVVGTLYELAAGYLWTQNVTIIVPCSATPGSWNRIIGTVAYANNAGVCDVSCGDCNDPNVRPTDGFNYYSDDTLWVRVDPAPPPPAPVILQDTLTLVEQGQTQAYIPFSLCNDDQCFGVTMGYNIKSKGHVGAALNFTSSILVPPAHCVDVYGIINAGSGVICTYDTLTIIAWTPAPGALYDTCVQIIHVVEPRTVPLFTVPVVTILVLALILAAAVFMRRRAVSRA
jgi:hypothetical protein